MGKIFDDFFYESKHSKVSESAVVKHGLSTLAIVVACLLSLSVTAYAYFSHGVTSASNKVRAAVFKTNVTVNLNDQNGEVVPVTTSNHKSHVVELKAGNNYFVTITHNELSSTNTGYVTLYSDQFEKKYHTAQVSKNANGTSETLTFLLTVETDSVVTFSSCWGTSSYFDAHKNGETDIPYLTEGSVTTAVMKNSFKNPPNDSENTNSESTSSESTDLEIINSENETVSSGDEVSTDAQMQN